ncbi:MAG: ABC transporter permease, partial [Opitutales bacterium]
GGGQNRRKYQMRRNITVTEAMRYKQLMAGSTDVVSIELYNMGGKAQATYQNRTTTPSMTFGGGNENYLAVNQYTIDQGRNLNGDDIELRRPICLVGQDVVGKLFPAENPLNKIIKIQGRTYTVVGTLAARGTSFGQSQDDIVIIPITRYVMDFGAQLRSVNLATQAPSQDTYYEIIDKGITAMRIVRGLKPEDENDFELFSNESLIAAFAKVADAVSAGALVISAIALLAAGVGIMNIMLVSVTERTKEIGIRKSIGARKRSILTQFLIEAVVLSLAGGVAGILLGVGAGNGIALMMNASIVFPWGWTLVGLLVCTGIGVGFGFYPAWKASSLDPIEALRYE